MKTLFPLRAAKHSAGENSLIPATFVTDKRADESFDTLFDGNLKLVQGRAGYRFSLDAVLLAYFVTVRDREQIVDLGSGNGVIPLILAYLHRSISVTGLEFQSVMAERAQRNVRLNGFDERIRILQGDVRAIQNTAGPETVDIVVCNPPYRRATSGRISPNAEKRIARHESEGGLGDFVSAGAYLLPVKGRMAVIYSAVRSVELLETLRRTGIEPKRVRMVHSFIKSEASFILVEGVKGGRGGVQVDAPLVIYEGEKKYTPEIEAMLAGSRSASVQKFKDSKAHGYGGGL